MINAVTNQQTPWVVYRDPGSQLVYFVHSKCACSFYKKLFEQLNWQLDTTASIDWDNDLVFSYIRDPLIKHRMGIIEWFYYNNKIQLLQDNYDNRDFFQMLSEIVYLDMHSMSLYEHLGENIFKMHLIPIDVPTINHKKATIELIKTHSDISPQTIQWFLDLPPQYVSVGFKRNCIDQLLTHEPNSLIVKSLEYDQHVYDTVSKMPGFEPTTYPIRIQQLLNSGLSQRQAEEIADTEVANGQYLNWIQTNKTDK